MASQTTVEVTQEDLDKSARNDSSRCGVATAIARTFPKSSRIIVDVHAIRFTNGDKRYTYLTPPAVMDYIVAFDAGDELHPFRFRLRDDQRMVVRRQKRTGAGQAMDRATRAERYAKKKAEQVIADPSTTEAEKTVAQERAIAAEHERLAVKAEIEAKGLPQRELETHPDVPASQQKPRPVRQGQVFRRNERVYGARAMRVNNDQGPGDFRGPLDME